MALPQLFLTGDIRGEIKPCGCSQEGDMGGIERSSTYFRQLDQSATDRLWMDLGNFSAPSTAQGLLKSAMIAKHFQQKKLSVILPGPNEFARGTLNFDEFQLPYVLTNQAQNLPHVEASRLLAGQVRVFGYLSPSLLNVGTHKTEYLSSLEDFQRKVKQLVNSQDKYRILLFRGSQAELMEVSKKSLFDLIIPANPAEVEDNQTLEYQLRGKSFFTAPLKGQGITKVDLSQAKIKHEFIWLTDKYADDVRWKADFDLYQKEVEQLFFKYLEEQAALEDKTVYNGAAYCVACHQKEGEKWKQSRHANAWKTLENVKRTNDPECIICHSVGFEKDGFLSAELTPHLSSVQCENCHGVTPPHIPGDDFKASRVKVTQSTCKNCHVGSHSPSFSFEKYWPRIQH